MNRAVFSTATAGSPQDEAANIRARFAAARATGKRAKDAAESIGLSEGAAIAAHAGEHGVEFGGALDVAGTQIEDRRHP